MINHYSAAITFAGILFLGGAGSALAVAGGEAQEETALQETSLTLSQAIAMAEHQTGGKAFDAGVNVDDGKPRVIVETNGTQGVQTVIIDAQSGQIVSAHAGGEPD
jgi:uncharacterized membrane protein YkoI